MSITVPDETLNKFLNVAPTLRQRSTTPKEIKSKLGLYPPTLCLVASNKHTQIIIQLDTRHLRHQPHINKCFEIRDCICTQHINMGLLGYVRC